MLFRCFRSFSREASVDKEHGERLLKVILIFFKRGVRVPHWMAQKGWSSEPTEFGSHVGSVVAWKATTAISHRKVPGLEKTSDGQTNIAHVDSWCILPNPPRSMSCNCSKQHGGFFHVLQCGTCWEVIPTHQSLEEPLQVRFHCNASTAYHCGKKR